MIRRCTSTRLVVLGLLLGLPMLAAAQDQAHDQPTWASDIGIAGANAVAGAVTAAVSASLRLTEAVVFPSGLRVFAVKSCSP